MLPYDQWQMQQYAGPYPPVAEPSVYPPISYGPEETKEITPGKYHGDGPYVVEAPVYLPSDPVTDRDELMVQMEAGRLARTPTYEQQLKGLFGGGY
jgi:hypothetical protein